MTQLTHGRPFVLHSWENDSFVLLQNLEEQREVLFEDGRATAFMRSLENRKKSNSGKVMQDVLRVMWEENAGQARRIDCLPRIDAEVKWRELERELNDFRDKYRYLLVFGAFAVFIGTEIVLKKVLPDVTDEAALIASAAATFGFWSYFWRGSPKQSGS